jgi:16S rRNA (cytidine1402-2'-O)-methyltransferase
MKGKLFLVATPIGNLDDTTLRAIETLKEVDLILAEDTRRTKILLDYYQIKKPMISFFEGNEERKIPQVLAKLTQGQNIAQVSDSGTPLISDPGFKLVREAIKESIEVESIPGPSAVLTALTISGLPPDKFLFLGYLPKRPGKRNQILKNIQLINQLIKITLILFESPHRLIKTLEDLKEVFGEIEIVVCRELTKIHQEVRREKISQSLAHFNQIKPKGELTILF